MDPRIVVIEESEHYMVVDLDCDAFPEMDGSATGMLELLRKNGLECFDVSPFISEVKQAWFRPNKIRSMVRATCKKVPPCGS